MRKRERERERLGSMKRSQGKKDRAKKCCNEMLIQPERSGCPLGGTSVRVLRGGRGTKLSFKPRPLNSKCRFANRHIIGDRSAVTAPGICDGSEVVWACSSSVYVTTLSVPSEGQILLYRTQQRKHKSRKYYTNNNNNLCNNRQYFEWVEKMMVCKCTEIIDGSMS